jgi:4-hydroxythreonine-4-phosphate dehydrogenase
MGDFNGIGPEIILKSLDRINLDDITPVVFGHTKIFNFYADRANISRPVWNTVSDPSEIEDGSVNIFNHPKISTQELEPGRFSVAAGRSAMLSIEEGLKWCLNNHTRALVTAPISKEAVNKAGYDIPGHTEFLAKKSGTDDFMMMLAHNNLRVGLVTIHIPVKNIAEQIQTQTVKQKIYRMRDALRDDFGIAAPRIAVLGLNPHAGEDGHLGREELDIIIPALDVLRAEGMDIVGPLPADTLFTPRHLAGVDAVLAMYHDQGLAVLKYAGFGQAANITLGLPLVRTSVDHGTALDLAGKGVADPGSLKVAISLARRLAVQRLSTTP